MVLAQRTGTTRSEGLCLKCLGQGWPHEMGPKLAAPTEWGEPGALAGRGLGVG